MIKFYAHVVVSRATSLGIITCW